MDMLVGCNCNSCFLGVQKLADTTVGIPGYEWVRKTNRPSLAWKHRCFLANWTAPRFAHVWWSYQVYHHKLFLSPCYWYLLMYASGVWFFLLFPPIPNQDTARTTSSSSWWSYEWLAPACRCARAWTSVAGLVVPEHSWVVDSVNLKKTTLRLWR